MASRQKVPQILEILLSSQRILVLASTTTFQQHICCQRGNFVSSHLSVRTHSLAHVSVSIRSVHCSHDNILKLVHSKNWIQLEFEVNGFSKEILLSLHSMKKRRKKNRKNSNHFLLWNSLQIRVYFINEYGFCGVSMCDGKKINLILVAVASNKFGSIQFLNIEVYFQFSVIRPILYYHYVESKTCYTTSICFKTSYATLLDERWKKYDFLS